MKSEVEDVDQACFNELLKILDRRPHTSFEVKAKLYRKSFKSPQINAAIEKALELRLLNDKDTAEVYVSELLNKGYGKRKIIQALKQKGIDSDMIQNLISDSCLDTKEEEKAYDVFCKRLASLKKNKSLTEQKIKERLFRFMAGRGFSYDLVSECANRDKRIK